MPEWNVSAVLVQHVLPELRQINFFNVKYFICKACFYNWWGADSGTWLVHGAKQRLLLVVTGSQDLTVVD